MPDEELTLILRLRDEATAQMKQAKTGIGGSMKNIAKIAGAAALAIGAAVVAAGVKLFKLASDAEEADNVIGLAFGSMKQQAIDWSVAFAAATGSSKFESRELAADLGLIIRGMGFTEEATLGMSTQMVELAADMSSAKNVPLAEALDKIRAGLIGESEPLRTMGVLLSEARVKSEAYASGLAETGSELTTTQKVQARMNIILKDSVAMHGDLVNTQDSAANQWRAIQNAVKDNLTMLGQHFMPVFIKVLGWMRKGVDFAIDFTKSLHASSGETSRLSDVIGALNTIFQITWNIVKPLVELLVNHLAWSFSNVLSPVVATLTDAWTSWIGKVQEGYNWIARLVPGLDEVKVAGMDVSVSVGELSHELDIAEPPAIDLSASLAGGSPGASLAPSAKAADEALAALKDEEARLMLVQEDLLLVTDKQWASYQNLWEIGTPVNDILVSHHDSFGNLAGVIPSVTSGLEGLREEEGKIVETGETYGMKLRTGLQTTFSAENVGATIARAFEAGEGLGSALKSIGAQMATNLGSFFSSALSSIPIVGPFLGQFGGLMVAGLVKLGGKIWGGIKSMFGGPSSGELAGREVADGFRQGIIEGLSPAQLAEARIAAETGAGSISGAALHIAIRDAQLAGGATIEEAEAAATSMVQMLHTAEKEGPAAVERAMAEIQKLLGESTSATDELKTAVVADADEIADRFANMSAEEVMELREALRAIKPVAVDTFRGIRSSSLGAGVALQQFLVQILAVSAALSAIPRNVTTTITTLHNTVYSSSGKPPERRQHGGPVSGGSPYVVGEAGPEIFVPSSSGSVLPNSMAEEIGAAVAAALHRVPLVVPQDAVTDAMLRRASASGAAWNHVE